MTVIGPLKPLRDRIGPGTRVLFVGINPGIRSALTGHHFAGFSNRFWKLLYDSGLVAEPMACEDDVRLPEWGYGITNIVPRPTPGIDALRPAEYVAGRRRLARKIARLRPDVVVTVGVTVYRALFPAKRPRGAALRPGSGQALRRRSGHAVRLGLQRETIHGARVFVLPNPSGRNANFTYAEMLAAFRALRRLLQAGDRLPRRSLHRPAPDRASSLHRRGTTLQGDDQRAMDPELSGGGAARRQR